MTKDEKKEIVLAVLKSLQTNSMSVNQLTPITQLGGNECFELDGGRRVRVVTFSDSLKNLSFGEYVRQLVNAEADNRKLADEQLLQYIDLFGRQLDGLKWLRFHRGEWSQQVAVSDDPYRFYDIIKTSDDGRKYTQTIQDLVYRYGCLWGCIKDKTTAPPEWNCKEWKLLEGQQSYRIEFDSTHGWSFFRDDMHTQVTAMIMHEGMNLTDSILANPDVQMAWRRNTGNSAEDNSWVPQFADPDKPNVLNLDLADMGSGWGLKYRKVSFICSVYLPFGESFYQIHNEINIKL